MKNANKVRKTTALKRAASARKLADKSHASESARRRGRSGGLNTVKTMKEQPTPHAASKKAMIEALVRRPDGAAIVDIVTATGWQEHSIRAALTRLRKAGSIVARERRADGATCYRILVGA